MTVTQRLANVANGSSSVYKIIVTGLLIFELVKYRIGLGAKRKEAEVEHERVPRVRPY